MFGNTFRSGTSEHMGARYVVTEREKIYLTSDSKKVNRFGRSQLLLYAETKFDRTVCLQYIPNSKANGEARYALELDIQFIKAAKKGIF